MKTIVFLGPSLSLADAKSIYPGAEYLPPVACGDVLRCLEKAPKRIAIIDGFFHNQAAVWHKEILYVLSLGIEVYGASSMGALRAAELAVFGMRGIGKIFEAYQKGIYEDDDEVAVLHASAKSGYKPVSDAMVNIRATLASAKQESLLSEEEHTLLLSHLKHTFYQQRHLSEAVTEFGPVLEQGDKFLAWLEQNSIDQKHADAIALLQLLSQSVPQQVESFSFSKTSQLAKLIRLSS